jgi:hypothetical protein
LQAVTAAHGIIITPRFAYLIFKGKTTALAAWVSNKMQGLPAILANATMGLNGRVALRATRREEDVLQGADQSARHKND